jgi:hypothetical protein
MKNYLSLLCILAPLALLNSCDCIEGNGKVITKSTQVNNFSAIELKTDANVELVNDSSSTVYINGESNIIDIYKVEVSGNTLRISSDECTRSHEPIKLKIPVGGKMLEELKLSGSGMISSNGIMKSGKMDVILNGSGDFNIKVDAEEVNGKLNGSGKITLEGAAQHCNMTINGSGDVDATGMPAVDVKADINGSGNCKVNATTNLKATIRGSGDIYYKGSAAVSSSVMGSGNIQKMD